MESSTIEKKPLAVLRVECMNPFPHDPHTWREGFLWLQRKTCGGVPEWFKEFRIPDHRHQFQLVESSTAYLVWECSRCLKSTRFVQARFVWVSQTIYGRRLDDNPWEV